MTGRDWTAREALEAVKAHRARVVYEAPRKRDIVPTDDPRFTLDLRYGLRRGWYVWRRTVAAGDKGKA